jgi:hypothetical protein
MSLKDRVARLEQAALEDEPIVPVLIFWKHEETLQQAKERYKQQHGFPLPDGAKIIEMIACDMSEEGGGRELTAEELKD